MSRYTIEWRAPRNKKWHTLSVSAFVPFPPADIARYRENIAAQLTWDRGVVVLPDMVRIRQVRDGVVTLI